MNATTLGGRGRGFFSFLSLLLLLCSSSSYYHGVYAQESSVCIASSATINAEFEAINGNVAIPTPGSCCMQDVCGLACPEDVPGPSKGYGIAITISIVISFIIGVATVFLVKDQSVNFFVAGRSLPLWIVAITMAAQSIDSNALLGNADLSYKFHFWDGAVIPIGLGLSLVLNGIFLAHHVNNECVFTLPDIFAKRYGKTVEILVSLCTVTSFIMLLAGNLVGFAAVTAYVWGIPQASAVWVSAAVVWCYTACGGLFSVAYTDVVQGAMGWSGCIVMAFWFIANSNPSAPPPSIGFPGYIYPDVWGDGGPCDMYNGTACSNNTPGGCCYNEALWCPNGSPCDRFDRGAYPIGDQDVFANQMTDHLALAPFPNSIYWNWCTVFILGFGNMAALDFQARCMASKTPRTARLGCVIAGLFTIFIGIPFAYMGSITRVWYGPDSLYSDFTADSCAISLGLPTCAQWNPDNSAFIKMLVHQAPPILGGWCLVGIIAASMSTADGAILAMGTVMSHNVARQFDIWYPNLITNDNLLNMARFTTLPFTLCSALIASFSGETGYLLIVAFDIVLATVVCPLFGCFYAKNPSPRAALLAVVSGALTRIILEFALPIDGSFLLPYEDPEFLAYGPAASSLLPSFIDAPASDHWDPTTEPCVQEPFKDFTGVNSLAAFLCCVLVFLLVQWAEHYRGGRALFSFPGDVPYTKNTGEEDSSKHGTKTAVTDPSNTGTQKRFEESSEEDVVKSAELEEIPEMEEIHA